MKSFRMLAVGASLALAFCLVVNALSYIQFASPAFAHSGQAAPSIADPWKVNGSRIEAGDYLGTKNNEPLVFKVRKTERMRIDTSGNIGIGTTSPKAPLDVANGRIRLSSNLGDVEFTEVADLIAHTDEFNTIPTNPAFRVDTGRGLARAFTVLNNGNVGIGTNDPDGRLIVRGDGQTFLVRVLDQNGKDALKVVNNGVVAFGALYALPSTSHLCYHSPTNLALTSCSSAAEYVPTIDDGAGYPQTGDLVSIAPLEENPYGDEHGPFSVQKSNKPCDSNLLGFIVKPESGADGIKLNDHYLPLAIFGYFPAKVTLENGPVRRGDPLTSSSKPGYAMKATVACKVIGYALEDAPSEGQIQVFADLGDHSAPEVASLREKVDTLTQENEALKETLATFEQRIHALEDAHAEESPAASVHKTGP